MIRLLTLAALAVAILASSATAGGCVMSYCRNEAATSTPSTRTITKTHRQKVGDIYDPGHGRRLQVRDKHRRILFYIEADGTVTNTSRQPVANIEALR